MSDIYVEKNIATRNSLQRIAYDYDSSNEGDMEGVHITDSENENVIQNVSIRRRCKRVHNSTSNKRSVNGKKRMRGQEYMGFSTVDGVFKQTSPKAAKKIGPTCSSATCRKSQARHCLKFDEETRKQIFETFWNKTWEAKREFVNLYVTKMIKKRSTVNSSRKKNSFMFKLPHNQLSLQVCRPMFLSTLSLRIGMVKGWINSSDKTISASLVPKTNPVKGGYKMFLSKYDAHIMDKQRAQFEKLQDKLAAQEGRCHVFTMDAQAVKLCPDINASAIYYKQRLQVHNFTVYNLATHQCTNYWWNETDGDLSSSTFISCIIHHLSTHCLTDTLPIIIYSDGCGYQNRNHFLSNALANFSIENKKIIEQKYLEKGHTQMECDSAHAKIEAKLKNQTIYLPYDYVRVTKDARKTVKINNKIIKKPFDAVYLNYDFFKNYKDSNLIRFSSIRPGRAKKDPTVSQLRSLLYSPSGSIKFKVNFEHNYTELPIRIKQYEGHIEPKLLQTGRLPIPQNKWKHLQDLKAVIPEEYHYFYDNLSQAQ